MSDLLYYIFGFVVLAAALYLMKKVASCLVKAMVAAVIALVLGVVYYLFFI
ncbi:sulfate transporter [Prevotella sp. OH937_COT-195]|uniref:sulfate transporter n=1 Tax=Prevotella sp. OH937_COT-195 TaxID=2491051 RepID=UPI000F651DD4|nr:sulfate transporter [Prevotella sp. OH937_COT-195]RRD00314.1 sulfate transporter [Prevotella sp. OH937_COT-195]